MRVYVIRHGETEWNADRRLQGHSGSDLNENGILLAGITAQALKDVPFDICFSSPAIRATHTARILLEGRDVEIREDTRLQELGFGVWEGRSLDPSHPEYLGLPGLPKFLSLGKDVFDYQAPEGGETIQDLIARTGDFYQELIRDPALQEKTVLISTHGAAGRAFLYHVFDDKTDFWRGHVPQNCAVSILDVRDGNVKFLEFDRIYYPETYIRHYYGAPAVPAEGKQMDENQ